MYTQDIYQKTIKFAGEAHKNQLVPGTESNYLLHLSNVAMELMFSYMHKANFNLDFALQLALLHDSIEDTDVTYNDIVIAFGEDVANGVLALSKDKKVEKKLQLNDSIERINKEVKEVGMVKLADRITNLQKPPVHWNLEKKKQYLLQAAEIHKALAKNNEYLAKRLEKKMKEYEQFIME